MKEEYRIIKSESNNETTYSIEEVMLDDDDLVVSHTIDLGVRGKSVKELRKILKEMETSLDKQIFMEFKTNIR